MKSSSPRIEAFRYSSRSEISQYIKRDISQFQNIRVVSEGFEAGKEFRIDLIGIDEEGRIIAIKAPLDAHDSDLIDLIREVAFLNRFSALIRTTLSLPSMNTVFPARGILMSRVFPERWLDARGELRKAGIELCLCRPLSVDGCKFVWIESLPVIDLQKDYDQEEPAADFSLLSEFTLSKEEIEELRSFERRDLEESSDVQKEP